MHWTGFNSCISTCLDKFCSPFINRFESINDFLGVARLKITLLLVNLIMWGRTIGTVTDLYQWDQDLLWIITHIGGKDREIFPYSTISTDKNDSLMSSTLQWLYNNLHAMLEKVGHAAVMRSIICDMIQFWCWEIGKQYLALLRRFSADMLWYVTNSEIDGVCC